MTSWNIPISMTTTKSGNTAIDGEDMEQQERSIPAEGRAKGSATFEATWRPVTELNTVLPYTTATVFPGV